MPPIRTLAAFIALCLLAGSGWAGTLIKVPTRDGVTTSLFWEPAPQAKATVLLFPGGGGGFGKVEDGRATGGNFLVRSAAHFVAAGFNVAILGRPDDMELGFAERTQPAHLRDVSAVLDRVRQLSAAPVWLVGTSRGTVSVAAYAIGHPQAQIAGLVLTAAITEAGTPGSLLRQNLAAIQRPVLVLHHVRDACKHCPPQEVPALMRGLSSAPIRRAVMVDGGSGATGNVCEAQHWHGFVGMEQEAVGIIAQWMHSPSP